MTKQSQFKLKFKLSSRDWFGKASAACILGFFLALGLSGLFSSVFFGAGEIGTYSVQHQFTMWLISPMLACILSFCFLFRSGLRAWCWLGLANILTWSLFFFASL